MMKALIKKEIRLLFEVSGMAVLVDFLILGVVLLFAMAIAKLQTPSTGQAGVDSFALFAIFSFGASSMFLGLSSPIALLERATGILDTQLALVGSPRPILLAKVAVLSGFATGSFAAWALVGFGVSRFMAIPFVSVGAGGRALFVVAVVFPLSVALLSSLHIFVGTVFPKVAPLANVVFLAVLLATVANVTSLSAGLTNTAVVNLVAMLACMGAVLAGVIWLMGQLPRERLLGS
jgi:hypothetical protein